MTCEQTPKCATPCGLCPERWPVPAGSEVDEILARDLADKFGGWNGWGSDAPGSGPNGNDPHEERAHWRGVVAHVRAALAPSVQAVPAQGEQAAIIDKLVSSHGTGGWQTVADMTRFGNAVWEAASVQAQAGGVAVPGMVPAAWEYRLRISGMREVWTDWKRCSQAASADYANSQDPQWEYETRVLYAATPAATPPAGAGMVLAEREALRAGQSAAVMPLIGPLLDAWDGMSNDARAEVLDEAPDLAKYLSRIGHAMEAAPAPAATTQQAEPQAAAERWSYAIWLAHEHMRLHLPHYKAGHNVYDTLAVLQSAPGSAAPALVLKRLSDGAVDEVYRVAMNQHVRPQDRAQVHRVIRQAESALAEANGVKLEGE